MSNSIYDTQSESDLEAQAQAQAAAEIASQTGPLQGQIGTLQGQETGAIGQIGSMFDALQPFVAGEAGAVRTAYDQANSASRSIFEGAKQRLDQLAQQRAQRAQQLSQQMGGPVAVGEFTAGVAPDQEALAQIEPNALLHGLANAQAGEQLASAYSERVFPALRTEQVADARNSFENKIQDLRTQIDTINAGSGNLYNERLQQLQKDAREYELQKQQLALDKLKANRDWQATQRTLHNEDTRVGLAKADVTGTYHGRPTVRARALTAQERQAAQRLGLSAAQYQERVRHNQQTEATARARVTNQQTKNAMAIVDAATGRTKGGVTITKRRELNPVQGAAMAYKNPKIHIVKDKHGKNHYYIDETTHLTQRQAERQYGSGFANDPQQLYDLLIGSNVPGPMAAKIVRDRTGVGDFQPGRTTVYSAQDLANIGRQSFNELRGIALARGYKPNPKHPANTQQFIDFILHHQGQSP